MRTVLVATHGSASADAAVRIGAGLAARLEARLTAFCAVVPGAIVDPGFGMPIVETADATEARRDALRAAVETQLARCGVSAAVRCAFGPAALEIAAAARELGAELIVLGIGPHHLLDRAFGHETALQLAQTATVPVLAVVPDAARVPGRVLVGMDFSPTSLRSARVVAGWLRAGDTLHLLHVLPAVTDPARQPDRRAVRELLDAQLEAVVDDLPIREGVEVRTTIVDGAPARTLLHAAEHERVELVATGSHGYGFWKRLTIGSVASKIVRLSSRSVLVTPMACLAAPPGGDASRHRGASPALAGATAS